MYVPILRRSASAPSRRSGAAARQRAAIRCEIIVRGQHVPFRASKAGVRPEGDDSLERHLPAIEVERVIEHRRTAGVVAR